MMRSPDLTNQDDLLAGPEAPMGVVGVVQSSTTYVPVPDFDPDPASGGHWGDVFVNVVPRSYFR